MRLRPAVVFEHLKATIVVVLSPGLMWLVASPNVWYEWLALPAAALAFAIYGFPALWNVAWLRGMPAVLLAVTMGLFPGPSLVSRLAAGLGVFLWLYSLAMMDEVMLDQAPVAWWARPRSVRDFFRRGIGWRVRLFGRNVEVLSWIVCLLPFIGVIPAMLASG
jgi:hypothetical protein